MINAKQAQKLTQEHTICQNTSTVLMEVEGAITFAAKQGYSSVKWEKQLPAWVRQELTACGYRVTYDNLNIDITYIISWKFDKIFK